MKAPKGFTLIELLVSMAVVALLGLLVVQVISATSSTTRISNRSVDAASQARIVFDLLGADLRAMVRRSDTDFRAVSVAGNQVDFLAGVTGPNPSADFKNRGFSRIVYRVQERPENKERLCLVRAAKALSWSDSGFFGLKPDGYPVKPGDSGYPAGLAIEDADFDMLAPGVIVMAVGFQLYPDNLPVYFEGDTTSAVVSRGQVVYRPPMRGPAGGAAAAANTYIDPNRISSLVVGIVVLDLDSLPLLDSAMVSLLADSFTAVPPDGRLPVSKWMEDTANLSKLPESVPLPARQAVRIYQRFFPITPYGS